MRPQIRNFVLIICLLSAISFSCKKEQKETLEYDTQTSQDNALAEGTYNDVHNIELDTGKRHDTQDPYPADEHGNKRDQGKFDAAIHQQQYNKDE